jgi:ribosome-associated protein
MERTTRVKSPRKTPRKAEPQGALDYAHLAIDAIENKKGSDIVLLDVRNLSMFTDYFLICNGESERQIKAIAGGVQEALGKGGMRRLGHEGSAESGWVLLDYADLMVHIFAPAQRDYYELEELWKEAPRVVTIQ